MRQESFMARLVGGRVAEASDVRPRSVREHEPRLVNALMIIGCPVADAKVSPGPYGLSGRFRSADG